MCHCLRDLIQIAAARYVPKVIADLIASYVSPHFLFSQDGNVQLCPLNNERCTGNGCKTITYHPDDNGPRPWRPLGLVPKDFDLDIREEIRVSCRQDPSDSAILLETRLWLSQGNGVCVSPSGRGVAMWFEGTIVRLFKNVQNSGWRQLLTSTRVREYVRDMLYTADETALVAARGADGFAMFCSATMVPKAVPSPWGTVERVPGRSVSALSYGVSTNHILLSVLNDCTFLESARHHHLMEYDVAGNAFRALHVLKEAYYFFGMYNVDRDTVVIITGRNSVSDPLFLMLLDTSSPEYTLRENPNNGSTCFPLHAASYRLRERMPPSVRCLRGDHSIRVCYDDVIETLL
jgi:hypothetical protein